MFGGGRPCATYLAGLKIQQGHSAVGGNWGINTLVLRLQDALANLNSENLSTLKGKTLKDVHLHFCLVTSFCHNPLLSLVSS